MSTGPEAVRGGRAGVCEQPQQARRASIGVPLVMRHGGRHYHAAPLKTHRLDAAPCFLPQSSGPNTPLVACHQDISNRRVQLMRRATAAARRKVRRGKRCKWSKNSVFQLTGLWQQLSGHENCMGPFGILWQVDRGEL